MELQTTYVRLNPADVSELKRISHKKSLETGTDLTWGDLLREGVRRIIEENAHDRNTSS